MGRPTGFKPRESGSGRAPSRRKRRGEDSEQTNDPLSGREPKIDRVHTIKIVGDRVVRCIHADSERVVLVRESDREDSQEEGCEDLSSVFLDEACQQSKSGYDRSQHVKIAGHLLCNEPLVKAPEPFCTNWHHHGCIKR